jgi:hypothetical protein
MKVALLILFWGVALAATAWLVFRDFDASALTTHGWIALSLGTVLSLLVGGGLMALVFYSARAGYDDRVSVEKPDQEG